MEFLLDYIENLSMFTLMLSIPLVIRSFFKHKPIKYTSLWGGLYAGVLSVILVLLSFQIGGYTYDIRYAPVILTLAYFGPGAGFIAGTFALCARLFTSPHWAPAIYGWLAIFILCSIVYYLKRDLSPFKKCIMIYVTYALTYTVLVPLIFRIFPDQFLFHFQYLLFVFLGVIIGAFLIQSYLKIFKLNDKLLDMYKMVEESESKYRLIAENTSDLIMLMTRDHVIQYFSPSHERVLGYAEEKLVQERSLCKFIHPDDVNRFKNLVDFMVETGESHSIEFRFIHKNGQAVEIESRCMPVKGEYGQTEHIVIISRDISERKKAEEMLLQSEKLSIVGELAAGVAHEIRNPLTTIKGFIQLYKAEKGTHEYNDLLLSELERIETITSEMLSLGKPQAMKLNRTNLKELVEYTIELLAPQAHLHNIQFKWTHEDFPFTITCEKNQLKQVFLNILKNAMEAMRNGGDIEIKLRKDPDEDGCILSFKDQGCGISEEILPRLGEPFYTLKEKGTGLGLMICHKIIKQHNGTITYQSKLNEGTLIEIRLPLSHEDGLVSA